MRLFPDRFVLLLLGTVLLGWLLPVRGQALDWAQQISAISIFALFFLHGLRLPRRDVAAAARGWRVQAAMLTFSFVAMPLAGLLLVTIAGPMLPAALVNGVLFCVMLPSTVQSAISYASMAGGNVAASVVGAAVSNVAAIVLTPALVTWLFGSASGMTPGSDTILRIVTLLLLPFVLGQAMQYWLGAWAAKQKALLSFFDRLVILIAVYVAIAGAVIAGNLAALDLSTFAILTALIAGLLAAAFGGAWALGNAIGLTRPDRISLLFTGAQKSIATGAPMAVILFGPSAGLIILPAILYHIGQLLLSAPLAAHLSVNRL